MLGVREGLETVERGFGLIIGVIPCESAVNFAVNRIIPSVANSVLDLES